MSKKINEQAKDIEALCADSRRAAYMISWRDRHIEKQKELIAGYEEKCMLMETLLSFALLEAAKARGEERCTLRISKASLTAMLGKWECSISDGGDCYTLTFTPKKEEENAAAAAER